MRAARAQCAPSSSRLPILASSRPPSRPHLALVCVAPSTMRMLSEQEANEIEVTWEDQQSINSFSRLNSTYSDILEDLRIYKEQREALEDLSMELELVDQDENVLYKIADTFVSLPYSDALQRLEQQQAQTDQHIKALQDQLDTYDQHMKQLKVNLYAKFGDNINLERD